MKPIDTFKAYFDAFEQTYLDDDWERIAPYFAADVIYATADGTRLEGRNAVLEYLRNDVESLDRRFDSRAFVGEPDISGDDDEVTMRFTISYRKEGAPDLVISGVEAARFQDNQIQQMEDVFDEETLAAFTAWMETHGASLG